MDMVSADMIMNVAMITAVGIAAIDHIIKTFSQRWSDALLLY
jgi:hypothetical protein